MVTGPGGDTNGSGAEMIPAVAVLAFFVGALFALTAMFISDRRALRQETAFWDELRSTALDGYGRVFDWADDDA